MVAVLYASTPSVYDSLDVDVWGLERDARNFRGPGPVICHPPCSRWSTGGLKVGGDHGLFAHALGCVRAYGGVLEHPADSFAFREYGLPRPFKGSWQRSFRDEWVTEVNQCCYGHRARKRTWLVYCGPRAPVGLDWSEGSWTHTVHGRGSRRLSDVEAAATPLAFAQLLYLMVTVLGDT